MSEDQNSGRDTTGQGGGDRVRGDRVEGSLTSGGSIPGHGDHGRSFGAGDEDAAAPDENNGIANGSGAD